MAKKVIEQLLDDLDGSRATQSVSFGVDGQAYQIDLNDSHADQMRSALSPYVEAARHLRDEQGGRGGARRAVTGRAVAGRAVTDRAVTDKDRSRKIRQWALDQGVELPSRGRIAGSVQQAYDAGDVAELYAAAGLEMPEDPAPKRSRRRAASVNFSAKQ